MDFSFVQYSLLGFFGLGSPGFGEIVMIAIVAVVLFGGRLPEVARSLGSSYQQFRKGLTDIQSSIKEDLDMSSVDNAVGRIDDYSDISDDYDEPSSPMFDPPPEEESEDGELSAKAES